MEEKNDPFLEEFTHPGDSTDIKIMMKYVSGCRYVLCSTHKV